MYGVTNYADENTKNQAGQSGVDNANLHKSPIQILKEDPNIRIVTDVPGLVWHIEYKVQPKEKKSNRFGSLMRRILLL